MIAGFHNIRGHYFPESHSFRPVLSDLTNAESHPFRAYKGSESDLHIIYAILARYSEVAKTQ